MRIAEPSRARGIAICAVICAIELLLAILAMASNPSVAQAQWSPTGVPVVDYPPGTGEVPLVCPDGHGGAFIAWDDLRDHLDLLPNLVYAPFMTHLDAEGRTYGMLPFGGVRATNPTSANSRGLNAIVADGKGGLYGLCGADSANGHSSTSLVHLQADCSPYPGWPADGLTLFAGAKTFSRGACLLDGLGGVFVVGQAVLLGLEDSLRLKLQHINADGTLDPTLPVGGRVIGRAGGIGYGHSYYYVAPDLHGGFFVAWSTSFFTPEGIFLQHVLADGTIAAGFATLGNRLPWNAGLLGMGPSRGGVICLGGRNGSWGFGDQVYFAMGFDSSGAVRPEWSAGPTPVMDATDIQNDPECMTDGADGLFLAWDDSRNASTYGSDRFVQHLRSDGSPALGWPVGGVSAALVPGFEYGARQGTGLVPDRTGGVYVGFSHQDANTIDTRVSRVISPGVVAPGWSPVGERLASGIATDQERFAMCDDGRGGAIVAFRTSTIALRAQHIGVDAPVGAEASLADMKATPTQVSLDWSSADAAIGPERVDRRTESESWIEVAILLPDGAGRVRFQDHTVTSGARYGYRLRYESNGSKRSSAETWVTVPLAPRFALHGAAPNPAVHEHLNIAFALEGELPAKLELFGIDGRRVISRDVSALGAGEHALNIAQGIRIAPGIYWVSLTQGGRHAGSRVVIVD